MNRYIDSHQCKIMIIIMTIIKKEEKKKIGNETYNKWIKPPEATLLLSPGFHENLILGKLVKKRGKIEEKRVKNGKNPSTGTWTWPHGPRGLKTTPFRTSTLHTDL